MGIIQLKISGSQADVKHTTKVIEQIYGVENIVRMSGIIRCADEVSFHRFIDTQTLTTEQPIDSIASTMHP